MSDRSEARDPASVLKKHYTTLQVPDEGESRYVMSDRNRARIEKIEEKVRKMRGK